MSVFEHTPGPWGYVRPTMGSPYAYVCDSELRPICELNDNRNNYEANARLIAAAPDLYEACRALVAGFGEAESEGADDDPDIALGRTALAKAEGRS